MKREQLFSKEQNGKTYLVSEDYSYKSLSYYRIIENEINGKMTIPSTKETLEAFIVPLCLEKARRNGIPTCSWEISYGYAPIPSIVYGIHYYSDPSEYSIVRDAEVAKEIIKHITNHGRYPFCYEPITESSEIVTVFSIFGLTTAGTYEVKTLAENVYRTFKIPVLELILVYESDSYSLACLTTAKYLKLSKEDTMLLNTMLSGSTYE